jgi:hypothetical protein
MPDLVVSNAVDTLLQSANLAAIKTNTGVAAEEAARIAGDGTRTQYTTTTETLAAIASPVNGQVVRVSNRWEHGIFVFNSADLSAQVSSDPNKGLYVAPSSAPTGTSGAWERRVQNEVFHADWFIKGESSFPQDIINDALQTIPVGVKFRLPARELSIQRAAHGSVNGGSAGPGFAPNPSNGILACIYLDKAVTLEGCGFETHLNAQGAKVACICIRASNCEVKKLRAGNCGGQLYLYESTCVMAHPSNFVQGSGTGFSIKNIVVRDCYFYDCDTGFSATPEVDMPLRGTLPANQTYFTVSDVQVLNNTIFYRRQGVEAWSDRTLVEGNLTVGLSKLEFAVSRAIRGIGCQDLIAKGNIFKGFSQSITGYFGIVAETSGYHHYAPHYEMAANFTITGNYFDNFQQTINVECCRGAMNIVGNTINNDDSTDIILAIRLNAVGVIDETGDTTNWDNKNLVDKLNITGNTVCGASTFFYNGGTLLIGKIAGNLFVGNRNTDTCFVNCNLVLDHPLENQHVLSITGNTALMNSAASASGTFRFAGLRPGNKVYINDNEMTPCAGGDGIVDFDNRLGGTISSRSRYSNTLINSSAWDDYESPPKPEILGTLPA